MGRRGQNKHSKQQTKTKNDRNVPTTKRELDTFVDKLLRLSTTPPSQNTSQALTLQREISELVQQVKQQESNLLSHRFKTSVDNHDDSAIFEKFMVWIKENGAIFEGLVIDDFPGYDKGLKATNSIQQGTLMIAVPRKLMLTAENASKSILGELMEKDQILKNMPNVALAMYLLVEKFSTDSFWKPYIDVLPKTYNTVLYFTISELEELHGSPTLESALKQIKNIIRQYTYFYKLINTSSDPVSKLLRGHFTYNEYCWAVSTVMTRQNTIPAEDGSHMINALIPMWDFCNHSNGTISTDYNPNLNRSECLALRNFKPEEQLFIFYGSRSNADFFIHNGFVYEENEHDSYCLHLGISTSDPLRKKRIELLNKLSLPAFGEYKIRKNVQPIDGKLLAFLRVFNMNEDHLQHWLESNNNKCDDLQYTDCALDTTLEKKAWNFLLVRLKLLLAAYKTTLEDDLKLITNEQITRNKILSIKMRLSEKRILKNTIEYVEQYIKQ